jgi:hypothetical protein
MHHGFGDVDLLFVVARRAVCSGSSIRKLFRPPSPRQQVEAGDDFWAAHGFDDEGLEPGLVNDLAPIIGVTGEKMLDAWGAGIAGGVEDRLRARRVDIISAPSPLSEPRANSRGRRGDHAAHFSSLLLYCKSRKPAAPISTERAGDAAWTPP